MFNLFFKYPPKKCICKAPFASMYFRPDGSVTPCCFNTSYVYGRYPENSVREIWEGNAVKTFRNFILNNDLSHGCQICKKHISSNNIEAAGMQHYEMFKLNRTRPVKFEFELSHQCNLNCIMCFQPKDSRSTSKIYDQEFIKQISAFLPTIQDLEFFGGEPFSIELYYDLWEEINKINPECIVIIQTNGTIWNERVKNIIEHGRYKISVSLDAIDELLYEHIRVNAHLSKTLENIAHFNEYMKSTNDKLNIAVCPMRNNAFNIPDIIRFTTNINANIYFHTVFYPPKLSLIYYSKKELEEILNHYRDFSNEFKDISPQNKRSLQILTNQITTFISNWSKSENLIELNNDFENCFIITMNKIEQYLSKEELPATREKLHLMFSELLATFPVVYGINHIMNNADRNFIIDLIRKSDHQELVEYFITYTLFSIE